MNRITKNVRLASTLSSVAVASSLLYAAPSLAQEADTATKSAPGEIVVTARKREEDILKTPVTVSALTTEQLEVRGVVSMQDMAESTPGININNASSGHADRSFQQISLRGMTPVSTLATTTAMFIDGVPISSPSPFTSLSNPERIEVLKGPQSAYFGRNTFAGAINVVNKEPESYWTGTLTGMLGTRNNMRLQGSIEGPIIGDALTFRLTGDTFKKDGSWKNTDGSTLGDESSTIFTGLIVAKPTDTLTIKAFGMLAKDDDGPAAQTRILANDITDGSGNVVYASQSNCSFDYTNSSGVAVSNPYVCGELPTTVNGVSANPYLSDSDRTWLDSVADQRLMSGDNAIQDYGLLRHTQHAHVVADWEASDTLTVSVLGGYNHEEWSTLIDLDGFDTSMTYDPFNLSNSKGYFDWPYLIERRTGDWSTEGRLTYDNGPIHAVAGVSYLEAFMYSGLGSPSYGGFYSAGGKSESRTWGFFGGFTYDVTPDISISVEGRYQIDKMLSFNGSSEVTIEEDYYLPAGTYAAGELLAEGTYKTFTPRVIANWQVTPDFMVYGSVAKGVNPSQFNTFLITQDASVQAAASDLGIPLALDPEELWNYELGVKGRALNDMASYSASVYYATWRNQITSYNFTIDNELYSGSANAGATDLYGIEANGALRLSDLITIDAAGAINVTDIQEFVAPSVTTLTGVSDFSGNELPLTSKYSANVGVTFGGDVKGQDNATWFWRTDWNYKSRIYSNVANTTWVPDRHLVNTRAGITLGNFDLQVFVNNVFNNKTPVSISDNWSIGPVSQYSIGTFDALQVGLPELRTAGIQVKVTY